MKDKKKLNLIQYVKETNVFFKTQYGSNISRSLHLTGAAITVSFFIVAGKLFMGILSLSFFACANAFYSIGMIVAKSIALTGIRKASDINKQYQYFIYSSTVLICSSLLYILYSVRLFYSPMTASYHMIAALGIAAVTFTEVGLNIRGVIVTRYNNTLLLHAIKMINLSASFIALVLTQTALLSFTGNEADPVEISNANGLIGILMGTVAAFIGFSMLYRVRMLKNKEIESAKNNSLHL
ncbi:hypothetical protein R2R35_23550 [Anaerocolumna sp. AGMB13020]|uniref:hypothetical protein n=1 Tax=Anaerocolumna sp. AGMB13020 TaxID=3081750 RepID=UPI0029538583|nr:hypothetical protein [Anaerocolumna sp. AGMB13020]WOO36730.1 hypothetical protein R2R35_23550 [Anaerocolumna sp. AGMB13020]